MIDPYPIPSHFTVYIAPILHFLGKKSPYLSRNTETVEYVTLHASSPHRGRRREGRGGGDARNNKDGAAHGCFALCKERRQERTLRVDGLGWIFLLNPCHNFVEYDFMYENLCGNAIYTLFQY